ncbi:HD-GYP domain-containing protein [Candidatus Sodalis sp. SoCistrobi]|uniref:HD-GYP domain-containing protein n=1 Tax=Candidatus Sodalis sp. SoCistrobi TaxID=1922216 RepID=UPI00093A394E|nr:HD-GYP domain-containing protein [Candidatus Sodalis sp. SoCistrobi]
MIKRLGVNALRLGMYVQRLELSRHSSTTLRDGFLLTTSAQITAIHRVGIKHVWIDELKGMRAVNARPWFSQVPGLSAPPASAAGDGIDSALENARQICLDGTLQMKQIFSDARLGKILDPLETLPLVESVIRSIEDNPTALLGMAQLKTQDNYTYQHSVAVCALMIALGLQYRLPQDTLQLLGMGGLLHDLGKALIPASILNKPGRLTVAESAIIKQHPLLGVAMLDPDTTPPAIRDILLHHHEKIDGGGYPFGLRDTAISRYARMAAVCDVYDALTSSRSYKAAWNPAAAIRNMATWKGHFDQSVFFTFVKAVGIYPVGSVVRLASEHLAVVTEASGASLLHPKVRVFFSLLTNEPVPARNLDLAVPSIGDSIAGPDAALGWTGTGFPVPEASLSRNGAGYAPQRQQEREWEG